LRNAFSKKFENFKAAVALHYGYYNFVKFNSAIRHARDGGRRDKFCMDGARFGGDDRGVTERIANLKKAVETMHRCKAVHVELRTSD
jgi:hypothetical protein